MIDEFTPRAIPPHTLEQIRRLAAVEMHALLCRLPWPTTCDERLGLVQPPIILNPIGDTPVRRYETKEP